jgi:hypothetical protein
VPLEQVLLSLMIPCHFRLGSAVLLHVLSTSLQSTGMSDHMETNPSRSHFLHPEAASDMHGYYTNEANMSPRYLLPPTGYHSDAKFIPPFGLHSVSPPYTYAMTPNPTSHIENYASRMTSGMASGSHVQHEYRSGLSGQNPPNGTHPIPPPGSPPGSPPYGSFF